MTDTARPVAGDRSWRRRAGGGTVDAHGPAERRPGRTYREVWVMSGRVVHFELPFDDGERARTFYRQVFGWKLEEMPGMDYTLAMSGPVAATGMPSEPGFINGGLFARGSEEPRGPVLVINVASIDDALGQISASGGSTVLGKQRVGDMGFAAYFRDPEGNVVGLWETASA